MDIYLKESHLLQGFFDINSLFSLSAFCYTIPRGYIVNDTSTPAQPILTSPGVQIATTSGLAIPSIESHDPQL